MEITPLVQRKIEDEEAGSDIDLQINAIKGGGQPLPESVRNFFEPRFGHDFSKVRVHTDSKAAESARAVNAFAYTVGRDVVFGLGQFAPGTLEGRKLVAHELTHVVQQGGSSVKGRSSLHESNDRSWESNAEHAEHAIGMPPNKIGLSNSAQPPSGLLQRRVNPENVSCRQTGVPEFNVTGPDAVAAIQAADAEAIELALRAEELLRFELFLARVGLPVDFTVSQEQDPRDPTQPRRGPVNTPFDTILREELGLTLTNPAHFPLIQQQIDRFRRVRETLESGYLRYICLAMGRQSLVGCQPGTPCEGDEASGFSCPANRLVGLCRPFWFDSFARARTILHEPFHIWYTMARHDPSVPRRADASCFEAFALRVAGQIPWISCAGHTAG